MQQPMTRALRRWTISSLAATVLATTSMRAEIALGALFTDGVVLQREKPIPVWGRANPKQKIAVTFGDHTVQTTAGADGRWIIYLDAVPASNDPAEIVVAAANESVVIRDVLVGEVWLASGQSNMEWPISHVRDDEKKIAAVELPHLRHVKIDRTVAGTPADSVKTSGWQKASPDTVPGFTAVGYFFARELHRRLRVPIGIINSSSGGTPIESWMSDTSRRATSLGAVIETRWQAAKAEWTPERIARYPADLEAWQKAEAEARATKTKNPLPWPPPPATDDSPSRPGGLFNGMIAPLQPFALRGFLWYQGEANVGRANEYQALFPAMIRAWRSNWGDDFLPFYFVQLPNYADNEPNGRKWAHLREAQAKALELPRTAMAVTIDLGDPAEIHPTNKLEVGRRLAQIAKTETYHLPGDAFGPMFVGATREGSALRVRFTHAATGLVAHNRPVQSLELAGADQVFHPATGKIERDTLVVTSPQVPAPVAVRYAWTNAPAANLYNGAGLPAEPFRSDDW
jgi:Domain of unknown function (DUF303).